MQIANCRLADALVPTLRVGTRGCDALRRASSHAAERQSIAFPHRAWERGRQERTGGVYIAVLGTALIVSVLGLSAITLQRVHNRMLAASSDIRQAQLNAEGAIELGLLTMSQSTEWRSTQPHGLWFEDRDTGAGTCSLSVTDPADANLANDPDQPVEMLGIGDSGLAEQRVGMTVVPQQSPHDSLHEGSSAVPDWQTVFDYYQTNGTEISITSLPTSTPNLGRNVGMETANSGVPAYWTGTPPGFTCTISQSPLYNRTPSGAYSLKVDKERGAFNAGPAQYLDQFVKRGQQYTVEIWVYLPVQTGLAAGQTRRFSLSLYTKGSGSNDFDWAISDVPVSVQASDWTPLTATLTAKSWSGQLEYAFVKVAGYDSNNGNNTNFDFYLDDFTIRETTTGRFFYRRVLSPTVNPFGGGTNPQGLYWIDCNGNTLVIERSRILGTLLVLNPGSNSRIANGPNHMSPAVPGYPALLVDGNFAIRQTNRILSERENAANGVLLNSPDYNLDGTPGNYIYPSEIRGLVGVSGNLSFANEPRITGQVIVGGDVTGEADIQYRPDSLVNPPPGLSEDRYERRPGSYRKVVLEQ